MGGNLDQNIVKDEAYWAERRTHHDYDAYFNSQFEQEVVYVEPGQAELSGDADKMFVAQAGAGVVISVYDRHKNFGALSYVLIPEELRSAFPYFEKADPNLVKATLSPIDHAVDLMAAKGSQPDHIHVRLMGGSQLENYEADEGTKNYVFAREYVSRMGLSILNEDMGGTHVRRVHFFPATGKLVRFMLRRDSDFAKMAEIEARFRARLLS